MRRTCFNAALMGSSSSGTAALVEASLEDAARSASVAFAAFPFFAGALFCPAIPLLCSGEAPLV